MPRLLFEKTGNAIWMSHLDLMRVFQRAFKRAGLHLKHTQGFNPRPSVSIALPLSVGVESQCELLDFDLEGDTVTNKDILARLNDALVSGVRVLEVYDSGRKLRDLSLLHCQITLEYDQGIPQDAVAQINTLFAADTLCVPKKTKNGLQDQDIIPMIKRIEIGALSNNELCMDAVICCQNPTLNPAQIVSAISVHLPAMKPDFSVCKRIDIMDANGEKFR